MENEREVVLKIKNDNYKQVRNFLVNELGITKKEFEQMVKRYVGAFLVNSDEVNVIIEKQIKDFLTSALASPNNLPKAKYNWRDTLEERIKKNIEVMFDEVFEERLQVSIQKIAEQAIKERLRL